MERRKLLKQAALAVAGLTAATLPGWPSGALADITDVHIRPEYNSVGRFDIRRIQQQ